jgi:hypothetical protein
MADKEVTIVIEQFDNGFAFRWKDNNGEVDDANIVALKDNIDKALGSEIMSDITSLMDTTISNKVRMEIKYYSIEEDEK